MNINTKNRRGSSGLSAILLISALIFGAMFVLIQLVFLRYNSSIIRISRQDSLNVTEFLNNLPDDTYKNDGAIKAFEKERDSSYIDSADLYTYSSPEGIKFTSRSYEWDSGDLEQLYGELLKNRHGEELNTLSEVIIYPEKDDNASASHQNLDMFYTFDLDFPAIPKSFSMTFGRVSGIIRLYGGDTRTTVESMANSLSHEYGHHYTYYHMFPGMDSSDDLSQTEYARLRAITDNRLITCVDDNDTYLANHHWYLMEIAAEDYVQLMGSPTTRNTLDYYDVNDVLRGYDDDDYGYQTRNGDPQENLLIPAPYESAGLADYFYSFIGGGAPSYAKQPITLNIKKQSQSFDLSGGMQTFVYYNITWNKAYGEDAVYTLISYTEDNYWDNTVCIKAVTNNESASAFIGNYVVDYGNSVSYCSDKIATGTRCFIVSAITPDGNVYLSDPISYTFN